MIRILLVDDQKIVRQGIQVLLEPRSKLKVVGTAKNGHSAIKQVGTLMPHIVLMDIEMSGMNGIIATQKICQQFPKTKVIVLSSHEDCRYITRALQAGAESYVLKNILAEDLVQTIWSVYKGRPQIESKLLKGTLIKAIAPVPQATSVIKEVKAEFEESLVPRLALKDFLRGAKAGLASDRIPRSKSFAETDLEDGITFGSGWEKTLIALGVFALLAGNILILINYLTLLFL